MKNPDAMEGGQVAALCAPPAAVAEMETAEPEASKTGSYIACIRCFDTCLPGPVCVHVCVCVCVCLCICVYVCMC